MSIYSVDYTILINELLPVDKREPIHKAWLKANLKTIIENHSTIFTTFYNQIIAETKHNGQKIIMEDVLNTVFGVVSAPFIYIDNTGNKVNPETFFNESESYPAKILFNESEAQPALFFYNNSETAQNSDFIVYVPAAVYSANGEAKIRSEVDRLRPYGTKYTVVSY